MFLVQLVFVQVVIFGVVIFFLRKIMLGSTDSAVSRLNESYADINKKKEELAEKLKKMEEEYQSKKQEAEKIVNKMRDDADKELTDKKDGVLKKAREEAERIIVDAVAAKDNMREDVRKEEQVKMVDFCQDIMINIFRKDIKGRIDDVLITDFLDDLDKLNKDQVPKNVKEIELVTRIGCDDSLKTKILEKISKEGDKDLSIKETKDESILGGLVLKFGSLVLDGSLLGRIKDASINLKDKIEQDLYKK
jgi:F0F1-type ATP synthase membrane subunit b/b'